MKIVLFGSTGMLGGYVNSYLKDKYEIMTINRSDIDLSKIDEVEIINYINNNVTKDDIIINVSGVIKQRDYKPLDMIMVNSVFPNILAKISDLIGCKIIHITTDCVFSGLGGGYNETNDHDCLDDYGKSKSLGENPNLTTIRTSIIGEEKLNKKSLLEWVRSNEGKTINGYENHHWNGITCLELVKFIDSIIQSNSFWLGVRHIFSPTPVNKFELVTIINNIYCLGITINPITTKIKCDRTLDTLYEQLITKELYVQIVELKDFVI